jgi:NAD(P)-dependent dehydrogenase (short-subunit alcohol dehydrogenase family)
VVTGVSSGVVAGLARRVVEAGAAVVVHYRSDADGAATVVDAIGRKPCDRGKCGAPRSGSRADQVSALRHREPDARRLLLGYKTAGWASVPVTRAALSVAFRMKGDITGGDLIGVDQQTLEAIVIAYGNVAMLQRFVTDFDRGKQPEFPWPEGMGRVVADIGEARDWLRPYFK